MNRGLVVLVAAFSLISVTAAAQGRGGGRGAGAADAPRVMGPPPPMPQPAPGFVQPKTPWGDPDLQGFWPSVDMVGVPLQRPARFGTRNTLTEEEFQQRAQAIQQEEESLLAEIDVFTADVTTPCAIRCPTSPTPHWQETGKPSHQASLIIDPPDGRQPPLSEEGQKRQAQQQAEAARAPRPAPGARGGQLSRSQSLRSLHHARRHRIDPADDLQQRQRDRAGSRASSPSATR